MKKNLPITKNTKLINKKKLAKAMFDKNIKIFIMDMSFLSLKSIIIYLAQKTQIIFLLVKKFTVLAKILSKQININKHVIKLVYSKKPFYKFIYIL